MQMLHERHGAPLTPAETVIKFNNELVTNSEHSVLSSILCFLCSSVVLI